ncbi:MAG: ABC transporter ATP-binding protein [Alphaproteobacteria bacterium]|nr:ABC transporter ATP-binding protein [Alphaproteobacteria bacterium]
MAEKIIQKEQIEITVPDGPPLLSVRNLSVHFNANNTRTEAVSDISFDISAGETLALVGESGSGKSVTALSILRLLNSPPASIPGGQIIFDQVDLLTTSQRILRGVRGNDIAMIFQEPMTSLNPLQTIGRQIGETLELHQGMGKTAIRQRTTQLLTQVGIDNPDTRLKSFPHQLSGGQRQRAMIAMALANHPKLLIADEPTTALDVTVQAQILDLLKRLQRETGMAILFITHDFGIVRRMADTICVMKGGKIVERAPAAEVLDSPQHAHTKLLLAAEPKGAPPKSDPGAPVIVSATNLKVWFPIRRGILRRTIGHIKAVDGVDIAIRQGETLGVVGESGSGKSTLGLALLRLIGSKGKIAFLGRPIDTLSNRAIRPLRRDMQIVFQDPYGALSPRMTVSDIIAEGLSVHDQNISQETRDQRVMDALLQVGLDIKTRNRYPHEFSGGQRQRIAIARTLILAPKFIVLDEPTSALDMSVQAQIVDLLRQLQRDHGLTYMFISHDLRVVRALANHVIIMKQGKIVEAGTATDIFENPTSEHTRSLLAAALDTSPKSPVGLPPKDRNRAN